MMGEPSKAAIASGLHVRWLGLLLWLAVIGVCPGSSSPDDQCHFTFQPDIVLDVTASEAKGAIVKEDLQASNKYQCAEKCCAADGDWCRLALYHAEAGGDSPNCFLIQCVPEGSTDNACVKEEQPHSGFISAEVIHHKSHTTQATSKTTTQATSKTTTQATSALSTIQSKVMPTSTKTTTQATTRVSSTPATQTAGTPRTAPAPKSSSPTEQAANQTSAFNESQPIGTTQTGDSPNEENSEISRHVVKQTVTQTAILIVTLCFGLIFMLVMCVVVGKRWCEGYKRRKYSKVDYLVNGMYS